MKIQQYACPALLAGTLLLLPLAAMAQQSTADLAVSIKINAACTIDDATLTFAPQTGGIAANVDDDATVTVNCSAGAPYQVGFGPGANAQGNQRRMESSGNYVNYQLYREAARTTVLGTASGTDTIAGTGSGVNQTITVYGRVPAQPGVLVGDYSDQVLLTLSY